MSTFGIVLMVILLLLLLVTILTQFIGSQAASQVPRRGKMTRVRGGRIHWLDQGQGQPVVLIHGLGGNTDNFTYALNGHLTDGFRVITIDRPGCGWSERDGPDRAGLAEQARMIAEFIEIEALGKPLVVGHSLGGAISVALALNHPDRVGALALICPVTDRVDTIPDAFKGIDIPYPGLIPVIAHTLSGVLSLLMEKRVFAEVFAPEPVPLDFPERGGGLQGRRPESFIAAAQDMARSRATVDQLVGREGELKLPIGILYGAADNLLDPARHGKAFAEKTGGTYAELAGKGHMIPLTAPKDCADFIRAMAQKV
ncbi:MAG: alpha/beta hydrolase [Rhodobacteraceae bacterium]|nr:MAG: alpha/beta hydrolase [Paracoccaceae bacterium]